MIHPRNLRLGALLVLLVVIDWLTLPDTAARREGAGLLAGVDLARVAALRIEDAAEGTTLERTDAGWSVRERGGFPAHAGAVESLLAGLAALGPDDLVGSEASTLEQLGLDDAELALTLRAADGAELARLRFAKPVDGARGSTVRRLPGTRAWRAVTIEPPATQPRAWIASRVLDLDAPRVRVLRIARAEGKTHTLSRAENGLWETSGLAAGLPPSRVDPLLLVASTLYVEDALAEPVPRTDAGLEPPALRLTFELEGGGVLRLELGGEVDGRRAVTSSGWPEGSIGLLSKRSAENLEGAARKVLDALGE